MAERTSLTTYRNSDLKVTYQFPNGYNMDGFSPVFCFRSAPGEAPLLTVTASPSVNGSEAVTRGDTVVLTLKIADLAVFGAENIYNGVYDSNLPKDGFVNKFVGGPHTQYIDGSYGDEVFSDSVFVEIGGREVPVILESGNIGVASSVLLADLNVAVLAAEAAEAGAETAAAEAVMATVNKLDLNGSNVAGNAATLRSNIGAVGSVSLTSGTGSTQVGYQSALSGSVLRTQASKNGDVISAKDFGANGNGVADNATAFASIKAAAEAGSTIHFPKGNYKSSTGLRFTTPVRITADPGTRITLSAASAYVVQFDYTAGGGFFDHGGYLENMVLDGAGFATDGLSLKGVVSAQFPNVQVTNITAAGLRLHWAQLCLFNDFICSGNVEPFTTTPVNGIVADTQSCSANTWINPTIEKVSGHGVLGDTLINSVFINGTSEGNGGAGIRFNAASIGNTVIGMDLEVNTGGDVDINGADCNDFVNLKAGYNTPFPSIRVRSGSLCNTFTGGVTGDIDVDAGAVDTDFQSVTLLGTGATITDAGDFTRWSNLRNFSDNVKIPDRAVALNALKTQVTVTTGFVYNCDAKLARLHILEAVFGIISWTMANPSNPEDGQEIVYQVQNYAGGAINVIWGSAFDVTGWTPPAQLGVRTIAFRYSAYTSKWHPQSVSPLLGAAITAPTGGATIDAEARTAIGTIITRLQAAGITL